MYGQSVEAKMEQAMRRTAAAVPECKTTIASTTEGLRDMRGRLCERLQEVQALRERIDGATVARLEPSPPSTDKTPVFSCGLDECGWLVGQLVQLDLEIRDTIQAVASRL